MVDAASVMRRMARRPAVAAPVSAGRALRMAMVRAAEGAANLPLAVLGIREEEGPLDDLLGRLEEGLLILALRQGGEPAGLVALDPEARAAVIEAQALGRVSPAAAEPRVPTIADAALARPLLSAFLREGEAAMEGTPGAGWLSGPDLGERIPGPREAGLLLADGPFRVIRLTLDLGAGGRQGLLLLMLRLPSPPEPAGARGPEATVAEPVLGAELPVEAILHRLRLPLGEAESLETGKLLALPGATVATVRLQAGGLDLGAARLGQVAGMRAVRLEQPVAPLLGDLPPSGASSAGLPLLAGGASGLDRHSWDALGGNPGPGGPLGMAVTT